MRSAWTSDSHPIRVDFLDATVVAPPGRLGMTFAPGKQHSGRTAEWRRDLPKDLARLRGEYRTDVLVSLVEDHELAAVKIPLLVEGARAVGIETVRFPIVDVSIPREMPPVLALVERLVSDLRAGRVVVVHCMGGLGRTGLIAGCVAVALGRTAKDAVIQVRAARNGTIETREQERFVHVFDSAFRACHATG